MGKYFGTDGIRGVANVGLTITQAYKVGSFLANYYSKDKKAKIVIGKDTRLSSSMFESTLSAAIAAFGGDAYQLGYTSTPCLAYVTTNEDFDCGVMISASHNPYYDNGIKVFMKSGQKLDEDLTTKIESYLDDEFEIELMTHDNIGSIYNYEEGVNHYLDWINESFTADLSHLNIALDLANGSACYTARRAFERKGAHLTVINETPDGLNINTNCGSTHLESLIELVKDGDYDIGFAFDGDADRVLAVDGEGNIVDGDKIMYCLAKYLKQYDQLKNNTLVTTVMSNIGLYKALDRAGIDYDVTTVGDRFVVQSMVENGHCLGGEQSGHIICSYTGMFGDGVKTALNLLEVMCDSKEDIQTLVEDVKIYPQLLVNEKVVDKSVVLNDAKINEAIDHVAKELGDNGRILVRPSGTEPLIRVMVEAESDELCKKYVYEIIDLIVELGYAA